MKLTPKKYQSIKERWKLKKSNQSMKNIHSASIQQAAYSNEDDSAYYRYVSCPLCQNDNYSIFHKEIKNIKYAHKKYQSFLISILVRLTGTQITSSILSFLFRRPINISGYKVVRCMNCGLLYRNPIYREKAFQKVYNEGYLKFLSGEYSQTRLDLYKYILNALDFKNHTLNFDRRRVLDIGCGFGLFLNFIKSWNWEPYGLDFAEDCIEHAQKVLGLDNARKGNLEENTFEADFFDVVTLLSVAAHLNDPISMFKTIHKILRPGGFLIIFTVNANSLTHQYQLEKWGGFSKNHLIFFDSNTISTALKMAGFVTVEHRYDNRILDSWSKNGTIPKRHKKYFAKLMRKEFLGGMLIVLATNGERQ